MVHPKTLSARVMFWSVVPLVCLVGLGPFVLHLHSTIFRTPVAPPLPLAPKCEPIRDGWTRLGEQYGFQFNVARSDFRVTQGTQDTPPFAHGYFVRLIHSDSAVQISFGDDGELKSTDPLFVFSQHFEKRPIRDPRGIQVGEDDWGYLDKTKIWRRVHLRGGVDIAYGPVPEREASKFDGVINSACFLPASLN